MLRDEIAFIYTLCDPVTNQVRYIGKTFDCKRRLREHLSCRGKTRSVQWIKSLRKIGLKPVLEILETVKTSQPEDWESAERFWIEMFRQWGFQLVNLDSGGMGGRRVSDEVKLKMSEAHRAIVKTEIWKARIGAAHKGMVRPESARKNMRVPKKDPNFGARLSVALTGKKHGLKSRYNMWLSKQKPDTAENLQLRWEQHLAKPPKVKRGRGDAIRGVPRSEETKRKLSLANLGKKLSVETKLKMSVTRRKLGKQGLHWKQKQ